MGSARSRTLPTPFFFESGVGFRAGFRLPGGTSLAKRPPERFYWVDVVRFGGLV
jgi:hypothetical protein